MPGNFVTKEAPVAPSNFECSFAFEGGSKVALLRAGTRFVTSAQNAKSVLIFVFLRVDKWSFSGASTIFGNFLTRMAEMDPSCAQHCAVDKEFGFAGNRRVSMFVEYIEEHGLRVPRPQVVV